MGRPYAVSGYDFMPPDAWADRSIHTFVLDDGPTSASLTITRAPVPPGQDFKSFANREIEQLAGTLPEFKLIDRREMVLDAGVTELVECRWTTSHGTVDQMMSYLPEPGGLVVFTGAAPAPMPASIRSRILGAMASARPRRDEPGGSADDA